MNIWVHNQMSLTKFRMILEEEDSGQCLRKKKTLGYGLDKNLVLIKAE